MPDSSPARNSAHNCSKDSSCTHHQDGHPDHILTHQRQTPLAEEEVSPLLSLPPEIMNDVLALLGRNAIALSLVCRYFRSAGLDVLAGCIVDLHSAHDVKEVAGLRGGEFAKQLRFVRLTAPIGQQGISELSGVFKEHSNCFPKIRELVVDDGRTPEQLLTIEQGEHVQHYVEDRGEPPIHRHIASGIISPLTLRLLIKRVDVRLSNVPLIQAFGRLFFKLHPPSCLA
ncbi:hypothetical protein T439DRAFT_321361 [Meredithblackwellia eburnea MCA 4105]